MKRLTALLFSVFLLSVLPVTAADYAILDTLDDETVAPEHIILQAGFWYEKQIDESTLINGPRVLLRFPLGPWAELGLKTGLLHLNDSPTFADESGFADLDLTLKAIPFRIADVNLGVAFTTKVPTADESGGLGTDEADFIAKAIAGCVFGDLHIFLNLGASIQSDPRANSEQDDFFVWGIGVEYDLSNMSDSTIAKDLILMLEFEGAAGPADNVNVAEGRYTDGDIEARFGFVKKIGWINWAVTGSFGITDESQDWGFRTCFSYNWDIPWSFTQDE